MDNVDFILYDEGSECGWESILSQWRNEILILNPYLS